MVALGVLLLISSPFIFQVKPLVAIVCGIIGVFLSTTHHRLKVDLKKKYYQEYVWMLGYRSGHKIGFELMECIYITSSTVSQKFGFGVNRQFRSTYYKAYFKFSRYSKVFIAQSLSREELMIKIEKLNSILKIQVEDYA